jgi:protein-L-isoaspartate(D-aspartate) O-methyltransferase
VTTRIRLQPEAIGMGMTSQRVRDRLIERLQATGISDDRVLNAIRAVPRHLFVDEALATRAYEDTALPIGHGQTISQPWVVAKMTETLLETPREPGAPPMRVLEIGTGSGYQAAILAALGLEVFTVERIGELLRTARKRFRSLGFNIRSKHDDGRIGWPELAPNGTLVCPVGANSGGQMLVRLRKDDTGAIDQAQLAPVVFVPLLPGMVD